MLPARAGENAVCSEVASEPLRDRYYGSPLLPRINRASLALDSWMRSWSASTLFPQPPSPVSHTTGYCLTLLLASSMSRRRTSEAPSRTKLLVRVRSSSDAAALRVVAPGDGKWRTRASGAPTRQSVSHSLVIARGPRTVASRIELMILPHAWSNSAEERPCRVASSRRRTAAS